MTEKETARKQPNSQKLYPTDALKLMDDQKDRQGVVLIDVSTPMEFSGRHLEDAINVNFFSPLFASRIRRLDRDQTYLLTCKVGGRSQIARQVMMKMGFASVYTIIGGNLLWEDEGLPFDGDGKMSRFTLCPATLVFKGTRWVKGLFGIKSSGQTCGSADVTFCCERAKVERLRQTTHREDTASPKKTRRLCC